MSVLGNLNQSPEARRIAELESLVRDLENKLTKLQLELAYNNYRIVDEPERVVTKKIPAKFGIEKVRR